MTATTSAPDPVRRRAVSGFTLYDVANSAFVTTVVTALGGPFLTALAKQTAGPDGRVSLLLLNPRAESLFAYAVSLSVLLQVLALPVLGRWPIARPPSAGCWCSRPAWGPPQPLPWRSCRVARWFSACSPS